MEKNTKTVNFLKDSEGNQKVETNPGFVRSLLISLKYSSPTKIFYIGLFLLVILTSSYLLFFNSKFKIIGRKTENGSEQGEFRGFNLPTPIITFQPTIPDTTIPDTETTQSNTTSNQQNQTQPLLTPTPTKTPTPTVFKDTIAPTLVSMTGPENGSVVNFNNFCFPMYYTDNVTSSNINVNYQFDNSGWSGWMTNYSPCYYDIANGNHTFSVQAKDGAGNTTSIITRTFTVSLAQDIIVLLTGQMYRDEDCSNSRNNNEANVTTPTTVNIFQEPGHYLYATINSDSNGGFSYSATINENNSLSLQPVPVAPSGYKSNPNHSYQTNTYNYNNRSQGVEIPYVPYEYVSKCSF